MLNENKEYSVERFCQWFVRFTIGLWDINSHKNSPRVARARTDHLSAVRQRVRLFVTLSFQQYIFYFLSNCFLQSALSWEFLCLVHNHSFRQLAGLAFDWTDKSLSQFLLASEIPVMWELSYPFCTRVGLLKNGFKGLCNCQSIEAVHSYRYFTMRSLSISLTCMLAHWAFPTRLNDEFVSSHCVVDVKVHDLEWPSDTTKHTNADREDKTQR